MATIQQDRDALERLIDKSSNIVFFGGAGVSTESGIPDFRSKDGLYHQKYLYDPEIILSHAFFEKYPAEFYRFYRDKMLVLDKKPNPCHYYLAELEKKGKLKAIVTQNIDGLHQMAGSKNVLELHGSIHRNHCLSCYHFFDAGFVKNAPDIVPHCPYCGGIIKPDVVLYGEQIDDRSVVFTAKALLDADLLIICGTSLQVYPAATLLKLYNKKDIVYINSDPKSTYDRASLVIHHKAGVLFGGMKA